jgi:amino-acid N-acetyltransferase
MIMSADLVIAPATPHDVSAIAALLIEAKLPHEDFAPHLEHFLVARDERGDVAGAIGAEVCGADALLRSFVVAPTRRRGGIGERLFAALEHAAADWGVSRWWLLTTTADRYFAARGFRPTPREAAPAAIAATREFRGLCPSMAGCWSRERQGA